MKLTDIAFATLDWSTIAETEHTGASGRAYWRTLQLPGVRVRKVRYTPGYLADHWCDKGHIVLCLEGSLHTELQDGRAFDMSAGMSYVVADDAAPHRSSTASGATLFIVD